MKNPRSTTPRGSFSLEFLPAAKDQVPNQRHARLKPHGQYYIAKPFRNAAPFSDLAAYFSENLSLKALSSALQRARPEPSAENRQPSRFAAILPRSPVRVFFDDLIRNPSRSAFVAPIRPVPPGTRSARSAAPSARHPRPTDPASRRPGRRPRPQRSLTKPRPEPAFHRASPAEISVKSLRTIPQTGSSERMMRVVNMKAFSARQTPLRQEKAAETRQKNRGLP